MPQLTGIDDRKRDERRSQTFSRRRTILSSSAFARRMRPSELRSFATPLALLLLPLYWVLPHMHNCTSALETNLVH
jgi:hypothetical protein